ncbi:hypothetical protein EC552_07640 [Helicobacter pylori]|nr:hypothetical protein EC552_07640 [Helicobacter pylori]
MSSFFSKRGRNGIQPFNHSTIQPFKHSNIQTFKHSIILSFYHSIILSFYHSINHSSNATITFTAFTKTYLKIFYFLLFPLSLTLSLTHAIFLNHLIP